MRSRGFLSYSLPMSTSLYQKYRPQQFIDVVGQEHIRTTLLQELSSGQVSHAYLFSGPRGIGKTSTARLLARAVNCLTPKEGEPCNHCAHCQAMMGGRTLDVVEIDAASNTGVDNVRENIIENARVAPSQMPWKVFIIDEVHMLSTSAFNALLKTLEEPPKQTMFILATTEIHKVPATIISRCERFQFKNIGFDQMVDRLCSLTHQEGKRVDDEVLTAIAKRSEGALRDAESLLGQVLSLHDSVVTTEMAAIILPQTALSEVMALWAEVVRGQTREAIERVNRLHGEGIILIEYTRELIEFLRKVLLHVVQQQLSPLEYLDIDSAALQQVQQLATQASSERLVEMIEAFNEAFQQQKTTIVPQLPLEIAIIRLTAATPRVATPVAQPVAPSSTPAVPPQPIAASQPAAASNESVAKEHAESPVEESAVTTTEVANTSVAPNLDTVMSKPSTTETPSRDAAAPMTFETVKQQWNNVLVEIKKHNHALYLTFKVGHLVSFEGNTLTMGYEYQFYQDRLQDARNREAIDATFTAIFGRPVELDTVVDTQYSVQSAQGDVQNIEQPSQDEVANVWELAEQGFSNQGTEAV